MNRGYIKLWRKTLDSDLIQNHTAFALWVWMLLNANYKTRSFCSRGARIELEPGQLLFGRDKVSEALGSTPQRIRTAIKYLLKSKRVTSTSTNRGTVVTIVNWHLYQSATEANNQHINQEPTSSQPAANHSKEVKEVKEEELAAKTAGGKESAQGGSDTEAKGQDVDIPEILDTPAFRTAWENWHEYRRQSRLKAYVPMGARCQLTKLEKIGHDAAIAAIENSIAQSYQGIIPPKHLNGSSGPSENGQPGDRPLGIPERTITHEECQRIRRGEP